jgi:serine protease Do
MTQYHPHKISARRLTLMASVAGIGLAVLLVGPGAFHTMNPPGWTSSALAAETMLQPSGFADMVAKVKPAVISVRVRVDAAKTASLNDNEGRTQRGTPFDRFFRQFGLPDGTPNGVEPRNGRPISAEGSGFFISADGYAVTNNHVVEHATTVQVVTDDGKVLTAKVIGTDPKTDLALIKVEATISRSSGSRTMIHGSATG